jgi:hypothetical protein
MNYDTRTDNNDDPSTMLSSNNNTGTKTPSIHRYFADIHSERLRRVVHIPTETYAAPATSTVFSDKADFVTASYQNEWQSVESTFIAGMQCHERFSIIVRECSPLHTSL